MTMISAQWSVVTKSVVFYLSLCAVLFALCCSAEAQQQTRIPKIGRLLPNSLASDGQRSGLLGRELRALGYVEGKNIATEYRYADNKLDRLPALAEELAGLKVDVLVAPSTSAVLALKNATSTIPIIFFRVSDPVAVGLINSLARPEGISWESPTLRQC